MPAEKQQLDIKPSIFKPSYQAWLPLLSALLIATGATNVGAEKLLRWKWTKGEILQHKMTQTMKSSVKAKNSVEATLKQETHLSWAVMDVTEKDKSKVATIRQKVEQVKMALEAPGQKFIYDSKDETSGKGPIGLAFKPALDAVSKASFQSKIDDLGKVVEVSFTPEMTASLKGGAAAGFSDQSLRQMIMQSALELPQTPVTKGSTWKKSITNKVPNLGDMILEMTLTYDGEEKKKDVVLDRIKVKIKMSFDKASANPLAASNLEIKNQNTEGTVYFDNAKGRLAHSEIKQVYTIVVANIEQKIDQTVTYTLEKK